MIYKTWAYNSDARSQKLGDLERQIKGHHEKGVSLTKFTI